jgi:hypothetical protein
MVVTNKEQDEQTISTYAELNNEAAIPGAVPQQNKQYFVGKRKLDFASRNGQTLVWGGVGLIVAVVVFLIIASHGPETKKPAPPAKQTSTGQIEHKQGGLATPGDRAAQQVDTGDNKDVLTASDLENTKNHPDTSTMNGAAALASAGARATGATNINQNDHPAGNTLNDLKQPGAIMRRVEDGQLGNIQPFRPTPYGPNSPDSTGGEQTAYQPVAGGQGGPEAVREFKEAVTKPSLVFTKQSTVAGGGGSGPSADEPITNFGLEPGFHISAHLESSASTIGGAPLVAVIEYDYTRDGQVLIPAGTRAVGKIQAASSTGLVSMSFTELYYPNGTRIPISAVGLDDKLHLVKGKVTGKNTGKQLALAALTGVGTLGAGFIGGGSSQAITQQQLAEMEMASNAGRGVDQVVQQMDVLQHIVVTVPAGIPIFVTFVTLPRTNTASATGTQRETASK